MKAVRGKKHDYLAMILDYSTKGKVKINMTRYVKDRIKDFPDKITSTNSSPASEKLFNINDSPPLEKERAEIFHTFVAKALFVAKRGRPDIQTAVAFLCTRVKAPTQEDWHKLIRMMKFLYGTQEDVLTLGINCANIVKWYADAAFSVHPDMKSHTGMNMTWGTGSIISSSRKQKLNSKSSTEAEL